MSRFPRILRLRLQTMELQPLAIRRRYGPVADRLHSLLFLLLSHR